MKKTTLVLITCTAAVMLLAGCGSASGGAVSRGSGAGSSSHGTTGSSAGAAAKLPDPKKVIEHFGEVLSPNKEILVDRPDPTIYVTDQEFQNRMGYSFTVPDGAVDVYYTLDTDDSTVGTMGFTLDGVYWKASIIQRDVYLYLCHPYLGDGETEVSCDFKDDPAMKVHGVDPEVKGLYIKYDENWEQYAYSASWYLDGEGYSISLDCYSEAPIDFMPVEVFQ